LRRGRVFALSECAFAEGLMQDHLLIGISDGEDSGVTKVAIPVVATI
jgi:hypothetical protein